MKKILIVLILLFVGCSQEPQTLESLRLAGQNAYIEGKYTVAIEYLHKALAIKASDRDALYYLGQTFLRLNQNDSAVYFLKRADILYPNNRELNLAIYQTSKLLRDDANTIKSIHVLVKTGDDPTQYLYELSNLNLRTGNIIVAFQLLRKLWENGTDDPTYYISLGNVAVQVDSVEFAVSVMREAVERFGDLEKLVLDLSIYLAVANQLKESEAILKKKLVDLPNSQPLQLGLATVLSMYDSKSKLEESLALYEKLRLENGSNYAIDSIITTVEEKLK